jgi:drug/metabolite transporter (DMT)-like permease
MTRKNTYTGYSIGCAVVWALILIVAQRRLDQETRKTLWLGCAGWWSGWTSATIARAGYPPPKKLTPDAQKRLGIVSLVLVALGLGSAIRLLVKGKRSA